MRTTVAVMVALASQLSISGFIVAFPIRPLSASITTGRATSSRASAVSSDTAPVEAVAAETTTPALEQQRQQSTTPAAIVSVVGGASSVVADSPPSSSVELRHRLIRCAAVGTGCLTTYALASLPSSSPYMMSTVQASAITGLLGCIVPTPAGVPAAVFCGSFAGMSGHIHSWLGATGLGLLTSAVYYAWDTNKIGVGKGGRLGTMAFLANLFYSMTVNVWNGTPLSIPKQILGVLGPATAFAALVSGTVLHRSRQELSSALTTTSVKETNDRYGNTRQAALAILTHASKAALMAVAVTRLFTTTTISMLTWARTVLAIFASSVAVKESAGIVLPVALVGLAGSFVTPLAAPICLGAFLGMTRLKDFKVSNFVQASVFAATLFHLGIFDGFGGKLGLLSFLGVLFGM
jgi:hypothetical protein